MVYANRIGVCSRTFCKNTELRRYLESFFSSVKYNESSTTLEGNALIEFLADCEGAIIGLERLDSQIIPQLKTLKYIGKYGVGLDKIDLNTLEKAGIRLGFTPGVNKTAVAELALTMILILLRQVHRALALVQASQWSQVYGRQLGFRKIGILGCGNVGKELIRMLQPFHCEIRVHDLVYDHEFMLKYQAIPCSLEELFSSSEVVSIHLPLTTETANMVDHALMQKLPEGSVLINTSRGGIVDETALKMLLDSGHLMASGLDVLNQEPPLNSNLTAHPQAICTPHIGGSSVEAVLAMGKAAVDRLVEFVK